MQQWADLQVVQSSLDAPSSCHGLNAVRGVEGPAVMQLVQVALAWTYAAQAAMREVWHQYCEREQ